MCNKWFFGSKLSLIGFLSWKETRWKKANEIKSQKSEKKLHFLFQNTVTLASEDLMEAEEWIIQIQKAIYSIHCQVKSYNFYIDGAHPFMLNIFHKKFSWILNLKTDVKSVGMGFSSVYQKIKGNRVKNQCIDLRQSYFYIRS